MNQAMPKQSNIACPNLENPYAKDKQFSNVHVDSSFDGLSLSLDHFGKVDIAFISYVTDKKPKEVLLDLKEVIFRDPAKWNGNPLDGFVIKKEYLSGDIYQKLELAKKANKKYVGLFYRNIQALQAMQPKVLTEKDISVSIGTPWISSPYIDSFIIYLFGELPSYSPVEHDDVTGVWYIPDKNRYGQNSKVNNIYGIPEKNALHIMEKTANNKPIVIYDTIAGKRVFNESKTMLALEKQKKLNKAFIDWLWSDPTRKKKLITIYQNLFGQILQRDYVGSYLTFPNMNSNIELRPYQKDAICRILSESNVLLAHEVGAGKTYSMICAGMKLREQHRSKKNMYVVPNNIVKAWEADFHFLYPNAKILVIDKDTFPKNRRQSILKQIRDEEWDGIIITYSWFKYIPISNQSKYKDLEKELQLLNRVSNKTFWSLKEVEKEKENIRKEMKALLPFQTNPTDVYFDDLGITHLFVDEAQNFKNLPFEGPQLLGIHADGSAKCQDMLHKVRCVQRENDSVVVFATGTPITNSIADAYIMQIYLQNDLLYNKGIHSFSSWSHMFMRAPENLEADLDPTDYRKVHRASLFCNLPELQNILAQVTDYYQMPKSKKAVQATYKTTVVEPTDTLMEFFSAVSDRVTAIRKGEVRPSEDNMLKITSDGRKVALDYRLFDMDNWEDYEDSQKLVACAKQVFEIWSSTKENKSTQVIYSDLGVPKSQFNVYVALKELLIAMGIPPEEIVFIHDVKLKDSNAVYENFRKGNIRILIGSTQKLGVGVNIQDKLIALHHLDIPWRPSDITQREGRIIRPGNQNSHVQIFRYVTQNSFDAYSWQLVETKENFISQLLSGTLIDREAKDVDSTVLDYSEVKALTLGNPEYKRLVELDNKLKHLKLLQHGNEKIVQTLQSRLSYLDREIKMSKEKLHLAQLDLKGVTVTMSKEEKQRNFKILKQSLLSLFTSNFTYRGFQIEVNHENIIFSRNGKYVIRAGTKDLGNAMRIDNFINAFETYTSNLENKLLSYENEKESIDYELKHTMNYKEQIETLFYEVQMLKTNLDIQKN